MKVDLPAPFSPSRAWTSPASTSRSKSSRARVPGKRLVTPRTESRGGSDTAVRSRPRLRPGDATLVGRCAAAGNMQAPDPALGRCLGEDRQHARVSHPKGFSVEGAIGRCDAAGNEPVDLAVGLENMDPLAHDVGHIKAP